MDPEQPRRTFLSNLSDTQLWDLEGLVEVETIAASRAVAHLSHGIDEMVLGVADLTLILAAEMALNKVLRCAVAIREELRLRGFVE